MSFQTGDVLLASLVFSNQAGIKRRPLMVIYDGRDDDVLVAPITSQVARSRFDIVIVEWQRAGLRLPSLVRLEKLATLEKNTVLRTLGRLAPPDFLNMRTGLRDLFATILPEERQD